MEQYINQTMSNKKLRAYVKESKIPNSGKGLFARDDIKKGLIIAEFKSVVKEMGNLTQTRSNIFFNDNKILECYLDDVASFANDAIHFTKVQRKIMESLNSREPFYKKYKNCEINATIKLYENAHRAVLVATQDILKDSEIYCHYGFDYWFKNEGNDVGFIPDKDLIAAKGEIHELYRYPGFLSYIGEFYHDIVKIEYKPYDKNTTDVILHHNSGGFSVLPFKNTYTLCGIPVNTA
jgi:SET domain-containing protein